MPPRKRNEGTAIAVLVLAICSAAVPFTFILAPLSPILAIVALALSPSAQRKIEESGGALGGEGMLLAGRIVAWVMIGISVLILAVIGIVAAAGGFDDDDYYSHSLRFVLALLA